MDIIATDMQQKLRGRRVLYLQQRIIIASQNLLEGYRLLYVAMLQEYLHPS